MSGAIPQLPQYAFMAWCLVKAQGQLLHSIKMVGLTLNRFRNGCLSSLLQL